MIKSYFVDFARNQQAKTFIEDLNSENSQEFFIVNETADAFFSEKISLYGIIISIFIF